MAEAFRRGATGVALKDESAQHLPLAEGPAGTGTPYAGDVR